MADDSSIANVYIVWPERRFVSSAQIETWFLDAVANRQIASDRLKAATCMDKARALDDAGIITIGKAVSMGGDNA